MEEKQKICGIVMPISAMGQEYSEEHWRKMLRTITDVCEEAGFQSKLVSQEKYTSFLHSTIFHNLYDSDIVIADVSGRNSNVFFELGIRITFDKPIVVIKDNITDYSFDTAPFKHIGYDKQREYDNIESFKAELKEAIVSTSQHYEEKKGKSLYMSKLLTDYISPSIEPEKQDQLDAMHEGVRGIQGTVDEILRSLRTAGESSFRRDAQRAIEVHNKALKKKALSQSAQTTNLDEVIAYVDQHNGRLKRYHIDDVKEELHLLFGISRTPEGWVELMSRTKMFND